MPTKPAVVSPFNRFAKATDQEKYRIIGSSVGEVGSGKTHFWLGAPGPIVVQTLDKGLEGVVGQFSKTKDIYIADYDLGASIGESFTHAAAVQARDKFIEDFEQALAHARTVIWDRESDVWNLFYYAEFGTDDPFAAAPPKDWDRLKGKLRRMISLAKSTDINFGLIQGMKNEWVQKTSAKTGAKQATQSGRRIRAGMDDIEALVNVDLEHSRNGKDYSITVNKSRGPGGFEIQDTTISNITFMELAQLIFPDSSEQDWI